MDQNACQRAAVITETWSFSKFLPHKGMTPVRSCGRIRSFSVDQWTRQSSHDRPCRRRTKTRAGVHLKVVPQSLQINRECNGAPEYSALDSRSANRNISL